MNPLLTVEWQESISTAAVDRRRTGMLRKVVHAGTRHRGCRWENMAGRCFWSQGAGHFARISDIHTHHVNGWRASRARLADKLQEWQPCHQRLATTSSSCQEPVYRDGLMAVQHGSRKKACVTTPQGSSAPTHTPLALGSALNPSEPYHRLFRSVNELITPVSTSLETLLRASWT